ncbi:tagatose 1,6-diphosphate aldolase GatY/KbaY [Rhodococcoides kyotonense]|uniref:Tagatose 1,6-diphosphate aldolase GatY/KbaY n=1 Tax=Rhodococcoides kyotonense TaxID=398843 RepID=A0A239N248_9NOCA|nr:tagatose 1,6-diphosphate aldolase GatY/KbaY [Rhodococcus kyotonensis]
MRADLSVIVAAALRREAAVPAISVYDLTTAQAVVAASERMSRPVILLIPPTAAKGVSGARFIRALRSVADDASVEVSLQLDHAHDIVLIEHAVAAGVDAVLADGSSLPDEENVTFVTRVRGLVGPDIVLEAELGNLAGDEDRAHIAQSAAESTAGMTDPTAVPAFLAASGAQLLAVAVGNVHGHYTGTPHLDWARIAAIQSAASPIPLVLHGASGIPHGQLAAAPAHGIGKINFNTELRDSIFHTLADKAQQWRDNGLDLGGLLGDWSEAASVFVSSTHRLIAGAVE